MCECLIELLYYAYYDTKFFCLCVCVYGVKCVNPDVELKKNTFAVCYLCDCTLFCIKH